VLFWSTDNLVGAMKHPVVTKQPLLEGTQRLPVGTLRHRKVGLHSDQVKLNLVDYLVCVASWRRGQKAISEEGA
jgi:hypothetical protein